MHLTLPSLAFVHTVAGPPPDADVVVALTPRAWEACRAAGLAVTVMDDHFDRRALRADRIDYTAWQLDWLDRLDHAVHADGALRSAANWLTILVDSVVEHARVLRAVLESVNPSQVLYVGPDGPDEPDPLHNGHMQFWPLLGDRPLSARLLPLITATLGIDYRSFAGATERRPTASETGPELVREEGRPAQRSSRREPPKLRLDRLGSLRTAVEFDWRALVPADWRRRLGRVRNMWSISDTKKSRPATLMVWSAGYGAQTFARSERHRGQRIVYLEREGSASILVPVWHGFHKENAGLRVDPLRADTHQIPPSVPAMLTEIDRWAHVTGAGLALETRIWAFVSRILPPIRRAISELSTTLSILGVNRVAAANPSTPEEFSVLEAARALGIERLLLQHGDHLFPYEPWLLTETMNFETLWSSDASLPSDLRLGGHRLRQAIPAISLRSPRVEELITDSGQPWPSARSVCYVPTMFTGDSRVIGSGYFEDAWYHRWHRQLLDWMTSHPHLHFVWKAIPSSDQVEDPIQDLISAGSTPNVVYETRPFVAVAPRVGRFFTDFPSTALYEAVHLGLPVLALSFKTFADLRPSAVDLFKPVVHECDDTTEALTHLERFVTDPPERWTVPSERILPRGR